MATLAVFHDEAGAPVDQGVALFFPAPASFTGEDVLELQGHGSPVVLDRLVAALVAQGARCARPGEFTERAFLNGKIDLIQAEAVADLIASAHETAARAALNTLQGTFSGMIAALNERLVAVRTRIEAALDFPEEVEDLATDPLLAATLRDLAATLQTTIRQGHEGRVLNEGARLVIAGPPNAGKSTLLNTLAGHDAAIVGPIPGTTRDIIRERVVMDGLSLDICDTAGLRPTTDPVEQEGVRRAQAAAMAADCILWLIDDTAGPEPEAPPWPEDRVLRVYTKIDRSGRAAGPCPGGCAISAQTGAGLASLRAAIGNRLLGPGGTPAGGLFAARRRHIVALEQATAAVVRAQAQQALGDALLLAEELRLASDALGELTGRLTSDDLLGRIFADFCIGK